MKVFRGLPNAESRAPCALSIGNFDGVHRGHQILLAHVRKAATELGIDAAVMTFEPHPREFFAEHSQYPVILPTRVANLRDKLQSLAQAGIDRVIVEHFNAHFSALSPQDFIEKVLVQGLHIKWLMVGEDFCFGARRAGNIVTLIEAGKKYGFQVETLSNVMNAGTRVSSSAVRAALADGDFSAARTLLGHPYSISGHVVHGQKLGRTMGFPTLNLNVHHKQPALSGIFVVRVHGLSEYPVPAVASIGTRPTVDKSGRVLLEAFLLDYSGDCYGKIVKVEFLKKLRDEEKYVDVPTLSIAIERDVENTRDYFRQHDSAATSATDRI
ncbi:bifunctional riboflavin kinase/FAD synthetase [Glaciimonas immobilis]|uniref:Riboflavin biosynthesis protein n=1 Tax=Glaciimonas immobilis TaxID=728004 RepID=A0A840RZG3_9BURK|nr:bifunctional riboflavin kinase/FAD synthetase [Glaciimonas immobilis]KAF3998467.1 bifunctional riboflavin kinase/FAD synthetase [Glaciimonas immobilis]MBB5202034.1 riboflavin kinase/FMN adenylyltransferase [Glaciimonas immobilis]